jgi:hypothetical protein
MAAEIAAAEDPDLSNGLVTGPMCDLTSYSVFVLSFENYFSHPINYSPVLQLSNFTSHLYFFVSFSNFILFSFCHFMCKWSHSPSSVSHNELTNVFIHHG